jgi:dihydroorotase
VFEAAGALDRLESFASFHGADFYDLPRNTGTITLRKDAWTMPGAFAFGGETIVPLRAGENIGWRVVPDHAG